MKGHMEEVGLKLCIGNVKMIWAHVKRCDNGYPFLPYEIENTQYWTKNKIKITELILLRWKSLLGGNF